MDLSRVFEGGLHHHNPLIFMKDKEVSLPESRVQSPPSQLLQSLFKFCPHPFTNQTKMALTQSPMILLLLPRKFLLQMPSSPSHLNTNTSSSSSQNRKGFELLSPYHANTHLDFASIVTFAAVFIIFSLLGFFFVYLRRCYTLRHTNNGIPIRSSQPDPPQGLHPLILQTLPHFTFSSSPDSSLLSSASESPMNSICKKKMKNECVICLEEFGDKETLLLLPLCGHVFHCQCIHMWLFSHTTCPLCRYSLLPSHDNPTAAEGEREIELIGAQNSCTQESSVDMEAPSQSVSMQKGVVAECKEGESSTVNIALKPTKLRRSYSTGHCLMTNEEGEECDSSSLKSRNVCMNDELSRSSLVMLDESQHHPHHHHHHHHHLNSEHSKGEDVKIGRSRSFFL